MIILERFFRNRPDFDDMDTYPKFVPFLRTFLARKNLGITWGTWYIYIYHFWTNPYLPIHCVETASKCFKMFLNMFK